MLSSACQLRCTSQRICSPSRLCHSRHLFHVQHVRQRCGIGVQERPGWHRSLRDPPTCALTHLPIFFDSRLLFYVDEAAPTGFGSHRCSGAYAYRSHQVNNGLVPFEVTVRREIESNLASVDPRFVAIVTMAFVALCVVDMLLGFLQSCNISLLGQSAHSFFMLGVTDLLRRIYRSKCLNTYLWASRSRCPHLSGASLCYFSPRSLSLVNRFANPCHCVHFSHLGKLPEG
jgi:hypothetical protein